MLMESDRFYIRYLHVCKLKKKEKKKKEKKKKEKENTSFGLLLVGGVLCI